MATVWDDMDCFSDLRLPNAFLYQPERRTQRVNEEQGDQQEVVEEADAGLGQARGRVDEGRKGQDGETGDGQDKEHHVVALDKENDPEDEDQDLRGKEGRKAFSGASILGVKTRHATGVRQEH